MRGLRRVQLEDIAVGAGVFGAGGGGSIREGLKLVDRVLEAAEEVRLVGPEELDDEGWGAVIAGMGSPKSSLNRVRTHSPRVALEMLEKELAFTSSVAIPFEIGGSNSLNPMLAAAQKGIPVVDGDPVGRAVPELHMTTFHLGGVSMSPLCLATEDNVRVVIRTEQPKDIERIARAVTAELQGVSAICCNAMQGRQVKQLIIGGTTTMTERAGAIVRERKARGQHPAEALAAEFHGYVLARGTVSKVTGETRGGFDFGTVAVKGDLPATVSFQNENMLARRGKTLLAIVPDLICALDKTGTPLTNADIEPGMEVVYLGFPAQKQFRSAQAFGLFSHILSALGYEGGFTPIEELQRGVNR